MLSCFLPVVHKAELHLLVTSHNDTPGGQNKRQRRAGENLERLGAEELKDVHEQLLRYENLAIPGELLAAWAMSWAILWE